MYVNNIESFCSIGLIKLPQSIQFSHNIQPVELPSNCNDLDIPETMRAIGSGKIEIDQEFDRIDGLVRHVALETIDFGSHPILRFRSYMKSPSLFFTVSLDKVFRSTLGGDSGGPLVRQSDGVQFGIIKGYFECDRLARYSYQEFTKVSYFFNWIAHKTGLELPECEDQANF